MLKNISSVVQKSQQSIVCDGSSADGGRMLICLKIFCCLLNEIVVVCLMLAGIFWSLRILELLKMIYFYWFMVECPSGFA
jgi:hypothetical protein